MTDTEPQPEPLKDDWDARLQELRESYPGQKDSILFCVHKLSQNSALGLPDIRDEAARLGVPVAGRALHSAKLLLGLATPKQKASDFLPPPPNNPPTTFTPAPAAPGDLDIQQHGIQQDQPIERQVLSAVRQIQSAAGQDSTRLRAAIQQAIATLQAALDA